MEQQNLSFLNNSDLGKIIKFNTDFTNTHLNEYLKQYIDGFITFEEPVKSLLLNAYGLSGLGLIISDPKKFFTAFNNLPLYEAFIDIISALFNSTEITINETTSGITINVVNHNDKLMAFYVDSNSNYYINSNDQYYKGFDVSGFTSLDWFFKVIFKRFVTAGININAINIIVPQDKVNNLRKTKKALVTEALFAEKIANN
ncbi:hypothetical protein ACFX5K_00140 [Rickettsiales bacterium LUAb2]